MAKVILINGSPRAEGCTFTALSEVASTLGKAGIETEIIQATLVKEDADRAAEKVIAADGLVLGSPVYYASASGLATWFFDELFNRISGKVRFKPGAAVVSCRRGGASSTFEQINKYFTIAEMPVVSSNYWNQVHGNTPDEVRKDLEGMQTMRLLGENMAYLIRCIEKAGIPFPEKEERVRTNFIR